MRSQLELIFVKSGNRSLIDRCAAQQKSPTEKRPQHCTRLRPFVRSSEAAGHSPAAARLRAVLSRSITARQPGLTLARCLCMQAVIRCTLGISWPHSRMASPVHICCASDAKAGPGLAESAVAAKADGGEKCCSAGKTEGHRCVPQGCARCWPLFVGGAARGLRCRTRHPSPGSHPVWLLDFYRCSNQKCCAAPPRIMRQ